MTTTTDTVAEETTEAPARMSHGLAVFNGHVNDAFERANAEFIAQFGEEKFDKKIAPFHEAGIMTILEGKPSRSVMAYVTLVTAYVNEGRV